MKNKVLKLLSVLIVIIFCSSCSVMTTETDNSDKYVEKQINGELVKIQGDNICSEWVDTKTGVHYFYTYRGGLEIRLSADGTPYTGESDK